MLAGDGQDVLLAVLLGKVLLEGVPVVHVCDVTRQDAQQEVERVQRQGDVVCQPSVVALLPA